MSIQTKMGNVNVSESFIKELRGFVRLWDQPHLKALAGEISLNEDSGYSLRSNGRIIYFVSPEVFLTALNKTQAQMRVNWFGK